MSRWGGGVINIYLYILTYINHILNNHILETLKTDEVFKIRFCHPLFVNCAARERESRLER